jgi:hypothetical protein
MTRIYEIKWYNLPIKHQKTIKYVLAMSMRNLHFTYQFSDLNFDSFVKVLIFY